MTFLAERSLRVFELVGLGPFTATETVTASVGDAFNPFSSNGTITCIDSPTAGPKRGTTETIDLTMNNIELRNSIAGDTIVPITDVFNLGNPTTKITQLGDDINGEAAEDHFGSSIALNADGTIMAVGAMYNDGAVGSNSGHLRVYKWSSGSWTQMGSDIDGEAAGDLFGCSAAISADGTIVAAGAYYNQALGNATGHVRVFK